MPNELVALARESQPAAPSEDEYDVLYAALSASGRGRAFLTEYARRNRHADTEMLLAVLDRLERRIGAMAEGAPPWPANVERPKLAIVPPTKEPELPIPSPEVEPPAVAIIGEAATSHDPLAAIMALSEDERLALFT